MAREIFEKASRKNFDEGARLMMMMMISDYIQNKHLTMLSVVTVALVGSSEI